MRRHDVGWVAITSWLWIAGNGAAASGSDSTGSSSPPTPPAAVTGTPVTSLAVGEAVVCARVDREARTPVGADDVFPADSGELACFTRIDGAGSMTEVVHVWKQDGTERARVVLPVKGDRWRTWSTKRIPASWTGAWSVEVQDADGDLLARIPFRVEAAAAASTTPDAAKPPVLPVEPDSGLVSTGNGG